MLTIFALQVFLVGVLVSALEHKAPLNVWLGHRFAKKSWVLLPFAILCVMLVVLYVLRSRFPLNWLVLVVFSMAQSVFFAALGTAFRTNIGVFNCVFTFVCICLMVVLSSVRRRDGGSDEGRLMSSFGAGMISFSISAVVASILFVLFGRSIITAEAFGLSLLFQLVLMAWFSLDASAMYQVMSPDEYMHGVIYFYTDMILLMVICAVAGMTIMLVSAACSDGDNNSSECKCHSSASVSSCNCEECMNVMDCCCHCLDIFATPSSRGSYSGSNDCCVGGCSDICAASTTQSSAGMGNCFRARQEPYDPHRSESIPQDDSPGGSACKATCGMDRV